MTETVSATGLQRFIEGWHPAPVTSPDTLGVDRVQQVAATLDLDERFADGDPLPPLWQWAFFLDWPRTDELGPDGHPCDGHFLPPIPNRRRMFAGGRLSVISPLTVGSQVVRHSEIAGTVAKQGRTGELLFVTVRHSYHQDDVLHLVEEQDLVYRSDDGASTPFARGGEDLAAASTPWAATPVTNPALLFRFSALTGNAHRIHYDEAYATGTEGYPGLVVHGPLLAVYMAELVRAHAADRTLRELSFRLQRPVFLGDSIRVTGTPAGASVDLAVTSGASTVHASATAVLA